MEKRTIIFSIFVLLSLLPNSIYAKTIEYENSKDSIFPVSPQKYTPYEEGSPVGINNGSPPLIGPARRDRLPEWSIKKKGRT